MLNHSSNPDPASLNSKRAEPSCAEPDARLGFPPPSEPPCQGAPEFGPERKFLLSWPLGENSAFPSNMLTVAQGGIARAEVLHGNLLELRGPLLLEEGTRIVLLENFAGGDTPNGAFSLMAQLVVPTGMSQLLFLGPDGVARPAWENVSIELTAKLRLKEMVIPVYPVWPDEGSAALRSA